jgi:hypothetical protein
MSKLEAFGEGVLAVLIGALVVSLVLLPPATLWLVIRELLR